MELFWYVITLIGSPELWLLVGVLPLGYLLIKNLKNEKKTLRHRQITLFAVSLLSTIFIVIVLKTVIAVPRPCTPCPASSCNQYCPTGLFDYYSFPSGHAASIFAAFTALYLAGRRKIYLIAFILPILVAMSRLYLGVHTIQDTIAGTVIGMAVPIVIDIFLLKFSQSFRSPYKRH
ncbi:MAG: phosphatase PAP2 family protein [Candidatus Aenigmatarchaeota archaeon]